MVSTSKKGILDVISKTSFLYLITTGFAPSLSDKIDNSLNNDLSKMFEKKVKELQSIIRAKDSRIQSLEDQLVKNARLFAKEATDLKLRIQEYQMLNDSVEEAF